MMIIGAALSKVDKLVFAPRFLGLTFLGKQMVWPIIAFLFMTLDTYALHMFPLEAYKVLFILAIAPPAANIAAFAIEMDLNPEKAASTILILTLTSLIYVPAMLVLFNMIVPALIGS
jgi:hypothetical protein